jgi:hypothetical protein
MRQRQEACLLLSKGNLASTAVAAAESMVLALAKNI